MKSTRRNSRRLLIVATRNSFRVVVVVCVCLSMWRAPLPWLHRHGESTSYDESVGAESGGAEMAQRLERHLMVWHSGSTVPTTEWHLHFAMLADILRGGGCPVPPDEDGDDQDGDALPVIAEQVLPADHAARTVDASFVRTDSISTGHANCDTTPACCFDRTMRRQFLSAFAESRCLQTVLCVAQC